MRLPSELRNCVTRKMLPSFASMAILTVALRTLDRFPWQTAVGEGRVIDRDTPAGRAIVDRQTIHVPDLQTAEAEFPGAKTRGIAMGVRTVLSTPLLREGIAIGAIHIRRREVRPFSDRQIKLLETFCGPSRDRDRERDGLFTSNRRAIVNSLRRWSNDCDE